MLCADVYMPILHLTCVCHTQAVQPNREQLGLGSSWLCGKASNADQ